MRPIRLLALCTMFTLISQAQQPPAPAAAVTDGAVEITIRDSVTKNPIPGARIVFNHYQTPPPNIVTYVNADENGHASFKNVVGGNYGISATRDGYTVPPGPPEAQRITVDADKKKFDIEVTLTRGATVSGRIVDSNGVPIAKAGVSFGALSYRDGRPTMPPSPSGSSTDDRGQFRIIGLAAGTYYVSVGLRAGGAQLESGVWDNFPRTTYFPGVIDPKSATPITIQAAQDLTGIDVKIPIVTTYKISGTVINKIDGGMAFQGKVSRAVQSYFLGSADPDSLLEPMLLESRLSPSADPDESIFEITSVLPGSYILYPIWDTAACSLNCYVTSRTPVTITDKDVEGLRISLKPNEEINGRVVIDGNIPAMPWEAIRVSLIREERLPSLVGGTLPPNGQISDPQTGEFSIKNVTESRFGVTVTGLPQDAYVSDVRQGGRSVFNEGYTSNSASERMEIEVRPNGGSVTGTIHNAAGMPLARSAVVLIPPETLRKNPQLYKRTTTDVNGNFTIHGVAPGGYKLFAFPSPPPGRAEENAQYIAPIESRGTIVNVMAGASVPVQATVLPLP